MPYRMVFLKDARVRVTMAMQSMEAMRKPCQIAGALQSLNTKARTPSITYVTGFAWAMKRNAGGSRFKGAWEVVR